MELSEDFDEKAYLARYPDVAAAVKRGLIGSGKEHYQTHGRREGRSGTSFPRAALSPLWWRFDSNDEHLLGRYDRRMTIRTIADVNSLIIRSLTSINPNTRLVAGIPRSGLLVANIIALHLNLPLVTLEALLRHDLAQEFTRRRGSKHSEIVSGRIKPEILIVDDSIGTGETLQRTRSAVKMAGIERDYTISYLAAYAGHGKAGNAYTYMECLEHPRAFEWNLLHHDYTEFFCVDMDGILCEDPTSAENDDGECYLRFLSTAKPKIIPTRGIGAIVTSRLEKFRPQTSDWLSRHGIKYKRLIMLDLSSAEERRRLGAHAKFKADVYSTLGGYLFVESQPDQSREIFELTGMPVFCLENSMFLS